MQIYRSLYMRFPRYAKSPDFAFFLKVLKSSKLEKSLLAFPVNTIRITCVTIITQQHSWQSLITLRSFFNSS